MLRRTGLLSEQRVIEDIVSGGLTQDDGVTSVEGSEISFLCLRESERINVPQEHLANKAILIHRFLVLSFWDLSPHLLDDQYFDLD